METDFDDIFDSHDANDDPSAEDSAVREDGTDNNTAHDDDATLDSSLLKPRVIRKPQPKLDAERLCGERGIPQLVKIHDGLQFKGKGHEGADLRLLMKTLEHWAHRLYPKLNFDECLDKIEQLGCKKSVKTCVKRIRLDMDDLTAVAEDETTFPDNVMEDVEITGVDPFDELTASNFAESRENPQSPVTNESTKADKTLTEDQLSRMERNRLLAREKRNSRLLKLTSENETYVDIVNDSNAEMIEID